MEKTLSWETLKKAGMKSLMISAFAAGIMIMAVIAAQDQFAVHAAKKPVPKTGPLVKSVIHYNIDFTNGKAKKSDRTTFTYSKKYPKTIKYYEYDAKSSTTDKFKYTFKNGKPRKMVQENSYETITCKYKADGSLNRKRIKEKGEDTVTDLIFQYAVKDYFTLVHHDKRSVMDIDGKRVEDYAEEIDQVMVTTKNGLLRKTVNRGVYANWGTDNDKVWYHFNGTYTTKYDRYGIAKIQHSKLRSTKQSRVEAKFAVKRKNGVVTSVTKYENMGDGKKDKFVRTEKYVFKYYKTKVNKKRYAAMINDIITEGGTTYCMYNWY